MFFTNLTSQNKKFLNLVLLESNEIMQKRSPMHNMFLENRQFIKMLMKK